MGASRKSVHIKLGVLISEERTYKGRRLNLSFLRQYSGKFASAFATRSHYAFSTCLWICDFRRAQHPRVKTISVFNKLFKAVITLLRGVLLPWPALSRLHSCAVAVLKVCSGKLKVFFRFALFCLFGLPASVFSF